MHLAWIFSKCQFKNNKSEAGCSYKKISIWVVLNDTSLNQAYIFIINQFSMYIHLSGRKSGGVHVGHYRGEGAQNILVPPSPTKFQGALVPCQLVSNIQHLNSLLNDTHRAPLPINKNNLKEQLRMKLKNVCKKSSSSCVWIITIQHSYPTEIEWHISIRLNIKYILHNIIEIRPSSHNTLHFILISSQ